MKSYKPRAEKIEGRIQELAQYSDEQDCLSRIFGTKPFLECQNKIETWMKEAGMLKHL